MELAMDSLKDKYEFQVRWEPYLLRPDTPPEGRPKPAAYTDPNNPHVANIVQTGASIGLQFANKSPMFPNTIKSHAFLEYAKSKDEGINQNRAAELLFEKYFKDGDMLFDDTLLGVASQVGFDLDEVKTYINDATVLENVCDKAAKWSSSGINGVPTFYMNGKQVFSGAQDKETFERVFDIVAQKYPLEASSKS